MNKYSEKWINTEKIQDKTNKYRIKQINTGKN
jgi:hypothetical protein